MWAGCGCAWNAAGTGATDGCHGRWPKLGSFDGAASPLRASRPAVSDAFLWCRYRALPSVRGTAAEASRLPAIRLTGRRPAVGRAALKLVRLRPQDRKQLSIGATLLLLHYRPWLSACSAKLDRCHGGGGVSDRDAGTGGKIRIPTLLLVIRQGGGGEQRTFRRKHGSREIGAGLSAQRASVPP